MNASRNQNINVGHYMDVICRRRWLIILPFCLAMVVGIVLIVKLPRVYEASALILVHPQRVSEKIVSPVVAGDIETRIQSLSQQIMSRSNLERVIEKFKLFSDNESKNMLVEEKLDSLRSRIAVEAGGRSRAIRDTNSFSITFRDRNPQNAMSLANGLAAIFIDENLREREGLAVGTTDFLDSEVESTRKRLEAQEQLFKTFREKNMGELPEQLDANLKILDRLSQSLSQKEESLRSARVALVALESEMAIKLGALASVGQASNQPVNEDFMTPDQLKDKLANLRAGYTEQHPDVVRLKTKIEKLEKDQKTTDAAPAVAAPTSGYAAAQLRAELVRQKTVLHGEISALENDIGRLKGEIREYHRRVEIIPKREQEFLAIKRDYENVRDSYNSLLNRKLEAEIGVNIEKKKKGEQFQIIDAARLPEKPVFPNLPKLFLITIVAGLGLGASLSVLAEMMDTSVRRLDTIEEDVGLTVLTTIPRIFSPEDKSRHRIKIMATAVSLAVALILTAAFGVLAFKGVDSTLELVRRYAKA
jgi:polysaccharide chain length determinant protein (PEP-CTERM system associated)